MSEMILTNWSFASLITLWAFCAAMIIFWVLKERNLPSYRKMMHLQERIDELEPKVEEYETKSLELHKLEHDVSLLISDKEKVDTELCALKNELENLEPLKKELAEIEARYVVKTDELNEECRKITEAKEKLEGFDKEKRILIHEIGLRKDEKKRITIQILDLKKEIVGLDHIIEGLTNRRNELQVEKSKLEYELIPLRKTVEEKAAERDRLNDEIILNKELNREVLDKLETAQGKLSKAIAELKKTEGKLETAKGELSATGADGKSDSLEELWQHVFKKATSSKKQIGERDRLDAVAKALEERKFIYHPRVLNAFHTALKSSAISPLVVLAGISGTGKSLLPRMYSQFMGIHFMGIAVQARWDSPQDMFGFYNYMERKYKSTPLARAMMQFERYNRAVQDKNCVDLSDQMLLVLLDEMNMARVEYYFSDFLSKLENRRDIDLNNDVKRREAEFILDVGHRKGEDEEIRVFPAENILFTGTMNEDESTQSLSDKVLDRASVMRFGRPANLNRQQSEEDEAKKDSQMENPLPYETWESWKSKTPLYGSKRVYEVIGQLDSAMSAIGKPFAYRVRDAIVSYVNHYPEWIPNAEQYALADQIEQRIMPKLRGINVDDYKQPLQEIQNVIDDLNDDVFSKAFKTASQPNSSSGMMKPFIWQGLSRDEK